MSQGAQELRGLYPKAWRAFHMQQLVSNPENLPETARNISSHLGATYCTPEERSRWHITASTINVISVIRVKVRQYVFTGLQTTIAHQWELEIDLSHPIPANDSILKRLILTNKSPTL